MQVTNYLPEQDLIISYQTSEDLSGLLWVDKKTIATLLPIARKVMIITVTLNYDSFSTIRFKEYPIFHSMVSFFTSLWLVCITFKSLICLTKKVSIMFLETIHSKCFLNGVLQKFVALWLQHQEMFWWFRTTFTRLILKTVKALASSVVI